MAENDPLSWEDAGLVSNDDGKKVERPMESNRALNAYEALKVNPAGAKLLEWLERITLLAPMPESPPKGWTAAEFSLWHQGRCNMVRQLKLMIREAEEHYNG